MGQVIVRGTSASKGGNFWQMVICAQHTQYNQHAQYNQDAGNQRDREYIEYPTKSPNALDVQWLQGESFWSWAGDVLGLWLWCQQARIGIVMSAGKAN